MRPFLRALQLLPKQNRLIISTTQFRIPCRPTSIPISLASYQAFSSTTHVADFRQKREEEFERLVQDKYEKNEQKAEKRMKRRGYGLLLISAALTALAYLANRQMETGVFRNKHFMPFTITKREHISSTAFILTLCPQRGPSNRTTVDPYKDDWEKGGWTVNLAQSELQIARPYTPLPPSDSTLSRPDELRFLIRKVNGGEVSTYLSRLPVGGVVPVQYGLPGVETSDLVETSEVLFLAGGTGISTAMQLAYGLYEGKQREDGGPKMHIVWANRNIEDCLGGNQVVEGGKQNRIVAELEALQRRHPDRLTIEYVVDEERTFIDEKKIRQIAHPSSAPVGSTRISPRMMLLCGSDGFIRYLTGSTVADDIASGAHSRESSGPHISGGILSRVNVSGWDIIKLN